MRIPLARESLGERVPELVGGVRPQSGDGGIGAGLQRLGATVENAAYAAMDSQARQEDAEKRLRLQDILEQNRTRDAADRATAGARMTESRDVLDALHQQFDDDIQTGAIDKTKALDLWRKRAADAIKSGTEGVPDAMLPAVQQDLNARAGRLEGKVLRSVTKRDRADIVAGIDQTLEYAQRLATTDPAKGMQVGVEALEQLGPHAGLAPDVIAKKRQGFLEGVSYTRAYTAVMLAKDNTDALRKADAFIAKDESIDPQKRATLLATSSAFQAANMQRAEAAAARAAREQEARLKRAEAEAGAFQALSDKGGALDPTYTAAAIARTAGTPWQAVIKAAAQQAAETGGVSLKPISKQRAELATIDARIAATGRNPELDKRRSQVERVLAASEADLKKDGLQAYVERGGGTPDKIDMSSPAAIGASIGGRIRLAEQATRWAEKPVSPFFDAEADTIRETLGKLPPRERSQALQQLANALPQAQAAALARQMDGKDKALALAFAAAMPVSRHPNGSVTVEVTTAGRYVSELIFKGAQAQKDGTSTKNEKLPEVAESQWRSSIATQLADVFPAQTATDNAVEAALYIAHGIAAEKGGRLQKRDLRRAVGMAVGGSIVERDNGQRVPVPDGFDLDALESRLRTVSPEEVRAQSGAPTVRAGGVDVPIEQFVRKLPSEKLLAAGRGRYVVIVGGRPVLGANGTPVVVGLEPGTPRPSMWSEVAAGAQRLAGAVHGFQILPPDELAKANPPR